MTFLKGKIVLIAGASSGIGAGTAKRMAELHCRLALVGRSKSALEEVANECREKGATDVVVIIKDLSIPEACREAIATTVNHFQGTKSRYGATFKDT